MPDKEHSIINIALVGGGTLCKEIIEKTNFDYNQEGVGAPIIAVADPDPQAPGIVLARNQGLLTFSDYHELYEPQYNIHLIIALTPEQEIFENILNTRPPRIRIMSYHVFRIFLKAIGVEERKLRDRTKEMATILNGIQDLISVITPDKEIADVNESFVKWIGHSREDVIGRKCYEVFQNLITPCNEDEIVCPLNEVIRNKKPTRQIMTFVGSNDNPRYFEINIFPIWEENGRISKFIEISRDITEHKKEEEEITQRLEQMVEERTQQLKETHDKLIHQDKMASLGKLSASVVHEINNPIAGILNMIMLIKRIIEEDSISQKELNKFRQYLDLMETETRRTSRIVTNLLAFSRKTKMEPSQVNLIRLIEKTLVINSNLFKINRVKVEKRLDPNLSELIGTEDQLQQVFMNIVSNACEAMEATGGGTLTIETRYYKKKDKIMVSFRDTGGGIPRENIPKLFEPFFTTKKEGKGVGLGLSVAYGIVQEHGGSIYVRSKMGKGTTFEVELPLKPPMSSHDLI